MTREEWIKKIGEKLVGRTVTAVTVLTPEQIEDHGWDRSPVILYLDDGHALYASRDDEGNGPGAMFTTYKDLPTLPVMR